jgi:hypothetical protein
LNTPDWFFATGPLIALVASHPNHSIAVEGGLCSMQMGEPANVPAIFKTKEKFRGSALYDRESTCNNQQDLFQAHPGENFTLYGIPLH